ncbi:MAG: hypothetical protein RL250_810 [Verrucomicrobiota bacterium]|jgi:mono/diheme cytochrome c family protein/glucose/arabinose dehydrogenase
MKALVLPLALLLGASAFALNKGNAGPDQVEIKFNLPPPKPLTPAEELATFRLEKGFRIELVASEPMIETPVAISFDDQGRMYVVEMRGYMRDLTGSTEKEPLGRVSLLTDSDGDGRMDQATPFLDGVVMPRSVLAVNGGALIAVPPELILCRDTKGAGRADSRMVVATDFGTAGGQPEHMANTPVWALDNTVYAAGYGTGLRLKAGAWQRGPGLGRGQWGLCQDDFGRLFYNYNSDLLRADLLPAPAYARNPLLRNAAGLNHQVMTDQSVYPSHPTPGVNRGYDAKTLRDDGTLAKATATCGAVVYRGDAYPADYRGNAFVPEPSVNLIKRLLLNEQDGVIKATDGAKGHEFLTSTDERFRPVQVVNGPDGCLYVVDMYRGIVQHTAFLTHYLEANIKARHLEQPFNQGRIWRIVPEGGRKVTRATIPADAAGRVRLLTHADGWVRDTAQRLLVEAGDASIGPALRTLATDVQAPALGRLHALWTLDGLGLIDAMLIQSALRDAHPQVRAAAARLAPPDALPALTALTKETDKLVLTHVAMRLSAMNQPAADEALAELLSRQGDVPLLREAALTGVRGRETTLAKAIASRGAGAPAQAALEALATLIASANKAGPFEEMLALAANLSANRDAQTALLRGLASDGNTGKGKNAKGPAPKLLWLAKEPAALASLQGQKALTAVTARLAWPGKPGAPAQPKIAPLNPAQTALFAKGKVTFDTLCAACHQPHGFGLDGLAPPLVDSDWVLGKPDSLVRIISHGLGGPVKVAGRTWDLTMPPLPQLSDEDVAGVLTYIRREWEHTASPVDAKFVHDIRAQDAGRTNGWTADELRPPTRVTTKK